MDKTNLLMTTAGSITGVQLAQNIPFSSIPDIQQNTTLLIQLVIALVSLVKILKPAKKQPLNNNDYEN